MLDERDAVISDALNHASLIDGIRLCKATRLRYAHADMKELETRLEESAGSRLRLIVTDGVFSMDGDLARLDEIAVLADRHDAAVVVDDSHATGVLGKGGRGTPDHFGVADRVDLITSTLGKALGGATGGSNRAKGDHRTAAPAITPLFIFELLAAGDCSASLKALKLVAQGEDLRATLLENAVFFRRQLARLGLPSCPACTHHSGHAGRGNRRHQDG